MINLLDFLEAYWNLFDIFIANFEEILHTAMVITYPWNPRKAPEIEKLPLKIPPKIFELAKPPKVFKNYPRKSLLVFFNSPILNLFFILGIFFHFYILVHKYLYYRLYLLVKFLVWTVTTVSRKIISKTTHS